MARAARSMKDRYRQLIARVVITGGKDGNVVILDEKTMQETAKSWPKCQSASPAPILVPVSVPVPVPTSNTHMHIGAPPPAPLLHRV